MGRDYFRSRNPWLAIWTRPRETIQQRIDHDPEAWVLALAAIAGIGQLLNNASSESLGDHLDLLTIFVIAVIGGSLAGIFGLYVGGALLRWTGRWIGGMATQMEIRTAIAWSSVPFIYSMLLWIPELALFGKELFTEATPRIEADPNLFNILLGFLAVEVIIAIWSVIVFLKCLGQVQGFSAWCALGNSVLAGLLIVIPIAVVVFGVMLWLE